MLKQWHLCLMRTSKPCHSYSFWFIFNSFLSLLCSSVSNRRRRERRERKWEKLRRQCGKEQRSPEYSFGFSLPHTSISLPSFDLSFNPSLFTVSIVGPPSFFRSRCPTKLSFLKWLFCFVILLKILTLRDFAELQAANSGRLFLWTFLHCLCSVLHCFSSSRFLGKPYFLLKNVIFLFR